MSTKYTIYWMYKDMHPQALVKHTLGEALAVVKELRDTAIENEYTAITMVGENSDSIGKPGVDTVKDGKTPDGVEYTWNKSSRIGATRK